MYIIIACIVVFHKMWEGGGVHGQPTDPHQQVAGADAGFWRGGGPT